MMAGADEPATLSGFCQPMAIAMVVVVRDVNPGSRASRARCETQDGRVERLWSRWRPRSKGGG